MRGAREASTGDPYCPSRSDEERNVMARTKKYQALIMTFGAVVRKES